MAKAKLGSGSRFKKVERSAAASGARNPAAVAASIGFKKYGKKRMEKMAAAGKKSCDLGGQASVQDPASNTHILPPNLVGKVMTDTYCH